MLFLRNCLLMVIIYVWHVMKTSETAMIGDGTRSLYTNLPLNVSDSSGSCLVDGIRHYSETAVPRNHPCHYCICYESRVSCYWKQCASPPADCRVMELENVCNPSLFVCSIPISFTQEPIRKFGDKLHTSNNRRFSSRSGRPRLFRRRISQRSISAGQRRKKRSLPVNEDLSAEFKKAWDTFTNEEHERRKRAIGVAHGRNNNILFQDTSCKLLGVRYNLGEVIGVASDPCMECRCAAGQMFCSPKCCFLPAPLAISSQDNSLRIRSRSRSAMRSPLYDVENQYERTPIR